MLHSWKAPLLGPVQVIDKQSPKSPFARNFQAGAEVAGFPLSERCVRTHPPHDPWTLPTIQRHGS
ncbi:hypothetical protein GCM10022381_25690 [Leifsonia kafniensis]|uniref:Uncharacterized protein n=1 Tax=Leifsonia kafniensis TaxID=475957 RepID=A0ABP7KLX9_9MICO